MGRDRAALTVREVTVSLAATLDGRRLAVSRAIAAPVEVVWTLLVDTGRWPEWGPSVSAVNPPGVRIRTGTTGRIRTPVGVWLPFEVTACEPYRWQWRVAGVPATSHRIDPGEDGRCRITFEMSPVAAPYVPVCARALSNLARIAGRERSDAAE